MLAGVVAHLRPERIGYRGCKRNRSAPASKVTRNNGPWAAPLPAKHDNLVVCRKPYFIGKRPRQSS